MRYLLVAVLFLAGCVGSSIPHNPMNRCTEKLWWQATTAGVTSNNPWNKFVRTYEPADPLDPWANFQEPELFPRDFRSATQKETEKVLYPRRFRPTMRDRELEKLRQQRQRVY